MNDRRKFLAGAGALAVAAAIPSITMAARPLPTRRIPGTDERLAVVGLGNSQLFRNGEAERSKELLATFFDYGGGYIDCSGDGANLVASLTGTLGRRDSAFIGSYFSAAMTSDSELGIRRLRAIRGGDPLDLIHTYAEDGVPNWDVLRRWKDEGFTRHIGLARHNIRYYEQMMRVMATGTLDFLQVNLSPLEIDAEERILPMAKDKGIAVTINRPFINGRYFSVVKGQQLPDWAVEFDCTSWAQFSLKYILSHPAVTCVLTETANPKHLLDNLGGGLGRMPDQKTRVRMRDLIRGFS